LVLHNGVFPNAKTAFKIPVWSQTMNPKIMMNEISECIMILLFNTAAGNVVGTYVAISNGNSRACYFHDQQD
jgi:hypothetical protein